MLSLILQMFKHKLFLTDQELLNNSWFHAFPFKEVHNIFCCGKNQLQDDEMIGIHCNTKYLADYLYLNIWQIIKIKFYLNKGNNSKKPPSFTS